MVVQGEYTAESEIFNPAKFFLYDCRIVQPIRSLEPISKDGAGSRLIGALITGENVNVRGATNTESKVLFQVSESAHDFLLIDETPVKDNSGQDWYKVLRRFDNEAFDNGFFVFDEIEPPAFINGRFIKLRPITEDERFEWHLD